MWLAYESGRLVVLLAAIVWLLWFTREQGPGVCRLALAFYGGVILDALATLVHLNNNPYLAAGLGQGLLVVAGMVLTFGSLFAILLDITRSSKRHKREAEVDHLTGLFNRRVFFSRGERALMDARVGICRPSVAVLDVDNMKEINDVYGHHCGDEVLRLAAKVIVQAVRHDDVPARHGGDEFAVLFIHTGPRVDTLKTRLDECLKTTQACGVEILIGLSVGVASYPQDGQDIDSLLYTADARMYTDKASKRYRELSRGECAIQGRT